MMTNEMRGSLIGSVFGLVFIEVNAGVLPAGIGIALRVLGIVAFCGFGALFVRVQRASSDLPVATAPHRMTFGQGYWIVVAAEVIAGGAGLAVLNGPLESPDAGVAWISLVVGVHFFGLAAVWWQPFLSWLGAAIALCGAGGLALAAAGAAAAGIAALSGVIPGVLLLGAGWWP